MQSFEHLPSQVLVHILTFLKVKEFSLLRECSKSLNSFCLYDADPLWYHVLSSEFDFDLNVKSNDVSYCLNAPKIGPKELRSQKFESNSTSIFGYTSTESVITCPNPYESVKLWRKANSIYHDGCANRNLCINGPYFLRAARFWEKIERWCSGNDSASAGNMIMKTLSPGSNKVHGPCRNYDEKCVQAIEGIYAFHKGQFDGLFEIFNKTYDDDSESFMNIVQGSFFGTASVYDHNMSMIMLGGEVGFTDRSAISLSKRFQEDNDIYLDVNERCIKYFITNDHSYTLTENSAYCKDPDDIGLRWFEEYARRLECNEVQVRNKDSATFCYLSPFPCPPSSQCSLAVTRGIQVLASSVSALEIGYFAYSIRIRILLPGENGYMTAEERGFETCQISTRHLRITDIYGETYEVNGPGVIGMHPLLSEGKYREDFTDEFGEIKEGEENDGEFQYESMTDAESDLFEGKLFMIPGSIKNPSGKGFYIDINTFSLNVKPSIFTYF